MYIYKSYPDMVDSIKKYCEGKIAQETRIINQNKPRSDAAKTAIGRRAAYHDMLSMLTSFQIDPGFAEAVDELAHVNSHLQQ